uniref:Seipin n=1 Tax=Salmo trutta TaxID=8032 RepID=A0A673W2E0_SALTR
MSGDPVGPALLWLRDTVTTVTLQARQRVLQGALLLCALGLLLWTAIFLYGSFYYSYMPLATYSTPVHYYYRTDCDSSASLLCSFPTANVSLLRNGKNQVMTYGQPYRISLELEMPESPANQELGMFMVKMFCYSRQGQTVTSSARSTMLRYRSGLLQTLGTLFLIPFFLSGTADQKQLVEVELFSEYREDSYAPSIGAIIEIQSQRVQIYSANLYIHAHFTGIRYFLYNFPTLSAVMGVASNLSFLSVLLLFSYLRLIWGRFIDPQKVRMEWPLEQENMV